MNPTPARPSRPSEPVPTRPARDPYVDPYSLDDFGAFDSLDDIPTGTEFGRRPSTRPAAREEAYDDPFSSDAWAAVDEWDETFVDVEVEDEPVQPRQAPRTRTARTARPARAARPARERRPRPAPTLPALQLPAFVTQADLATDRSALGLVALNLLSLLLMAIVLGSQVGKLPNPSVLHLDAAGLPDRWGPPGVFWRIPLIAAMVTLINVVLAWFLSPLDRFLGRFLLGAAFFVQLLAWVAVLKIV